MRKIFQDLTVKESELKLNALQQLLQQIDFENVQDISSAQVFEDQQENLKYSLKRLVRGLASGRDDARLGFSMALSEVLKNITIKIKVLWDLIIALTESKGSSTREDKDISIGRIFGIMAIVNSGIIAKNGIELQEFKDLVDFLLKAFHFKVYLRIPAMEVLLSLLEEIKLNKIALEGSSYGILKGIKTGKLVEEIWMVIRLQNSLKVEYDWKSLLEEEWSNGDPLDRKNLNTLVHVLKDSTILNPNLHPIWEDIFMTLIHQTPQNKLTRRITVLELWDLLEQTLFNSTHERKCMGFGVFNYLLKNLPQEEIVKIFTPNFTRCLMNNLSNKETNLNNIARGTAEQISMKAEETKELAFEIVLRLIGPYGSLNFDSISKTKTVEKILNNFSQEQVGSYITHLKRLFMNQSEGKEITVDTQKGPEVVRSRVLDQLLSLFKIQKIEKGEVWIKDILKFLVFHGFFTAHKSDQEMGMVVPPLTQKTQAYARAKLESVLGSLHSIIVQGYNERKYHGLMLNGEPWTRFVIETIAELKANDSYNCLTEFDESVESIFEKTNKLLKSIRKKKGSLEMENGESGKLMNQLNSFESLINHILIQAYSDPSDLSSLIDDFEACFANLWRKEGRSKKRKVSELDETSIVPIDVLVDIFLSLLSKPSAPLRALILDIFKVFSCMISEKSLEIIFEVLKTANGPSGSDDIFEQEDDVEEISGEGEEADGGNLSESEESSDDDNVEILENEEKEETDMNDDKMEEYDLKLAAIFKQRSLDQTQKKDIKKHALHFKLRVIDLLETFSQSQPQSPLILYLIENMLNLIVLNAGEKDLKDRLTSALRKILSRKEHPSSSEIDIQKAEEMLKQFHQLSGRIADSSFLNLCSLASVFLVKVLSGAKATDGPLAKKQKLDLTCSKQDSNASVVSTIYLDSFRSFITKSKSKLKPSLFLELFNRYPQYGWDILPEMVDLLGGEIKSYNLVQGYNILATLIKLNKDISGRIDILDAIAPKISNNLIQTLKSSSNIDKGPFHLNKERFRDLMKDLITMIRVSGRICLDHSLDWNHTELLSSINCFVEARNLLDAKWMKNLLKELSSLIKQ